jgi:hypothetical protein
MCLFSLAFEQGDCRALIGYETAQVATHHHRPDRSDLLHTACNGDNSLAVKLT